MVAVRGWADPAGSIGLHDPSSEAGKVRIYHQIIPGRVLDLESYNSSEIHLKKVVNRCTACEFTDIHGTIDESVGEITGGSHRVASHIKQIMERGLAHEDIVLEVSARENGTQAVICPACDGGLSPRHGLYRKHVNKIKEAAESHKGAQSAMAKLWGLEPPPAPLEEWTQEQIDARKERLYEELDKLERASA
jgi:hypothetical protein